MSADVGAIVGSAVAGLGYELVDFERTARGLLRVFIDKPGGISVEDCADVSNHLTRVFAVEGVDFDRLEVSSPGLDRPLKTLSDFQRFKGSAAKVRLNALIDERKRFDGVIESIEGGNIVFAVIEEPTGVSRVRQSKAKEKIKAATTPAVERKSIVVPLENIDRARLIPDV